MSKPTVIMFKTLYEPQQSQHSLSMYEIESLCHREKLFHKRILTSPGADKGPPLCGLSTDEYTRETLQEFIDRLDYREIANDQYANLLTWSNVVDQCYTIDVDIFVATCPMNKRHIAARFFNALRSRIVYVIRIRKSLKEAKQDELDNKRREYCINWIPFYSWISPSVKKSE